MYTPKINYVLEKIGLNTLGNHQGKKLDIALEVK
jgi:hypothetical protein